MKYLTEEKGSTVDCVFCAKVPYTDEAKEQAEYVVARSKFVFVVLNRYPYNNGHTMVIPYEHVASIENLSTEALTDMMLAVTHTIAVLRKVYNPHAFNVGANLGGAAGAGIAQHVHMHIVPRWSGDTNYLSVIGETRIIPDELVDTWRRLREAWHSVESESQAKVK
jgi:ATP adenylyltransferase